MRSPAALKAALAMTQIPALVRPARTSSLPDGMMFLLEVSAGDVEALKEAGDMLERRPEIIREAAGFFIEQVLFTPEASSYRVLGALPNSSASELRRHMALLLRWLHPDVANSSGSSVGIDRSVFANRITAAWEDLKTVERRADYDRTLAYELAARRKKISRKTSRKSGQQPSTIQRVGQHRFARGQKIPQRFMNSRSSRGSFFSRLLMFLRGNG